ncbi:MAG: 5'-nucleotidase C-terminal domain-containing protein, partial [Lachnospiraceae bacterium]|nr:5'-nucleotidase C-terminal domain-containing protein [Lachnospiraceae bacterium]
GMARLYTYIEQVRAEEPAVFLVDGGDEIQGNIMTDMLAIKEPDSEHPVMTAMNHMKYDAMTLGNHEFDWGVGTLKKILSQAEFPILGMNVLNPDGSFLTGNGWTIIERGGVKLAVIGVTTPDIPIWDGNKEGVSELTFEAGYAAVKRAVREIGDRADIFLVSAHMGQYAEYDEPGGSDAGEKIVFENPEVDILQVGHVHISVNGKIGKTPVIAVKDAARQIARIDVTLDHNKNIKEITTEIIEMAGFAPSEKIRMIPVVNKMHEKTITCIREAPDSIKKVVPAGDLIGSTTAKFQPENEIKGLPEWRLGDTPLTDLVLKVELLYSGADAAVTPLFRDISDLPEGPIHYGDIREIYFLDNVLCTVDVTGKELKNYMEWSAGAYNQWKPGDINISFNREYLYLKLDMFAGVDYEIDVSKPEGERIRNVMYKGEPLKDDTILKLAINNYRYEVCLKCMNLAAGKRSWQSSEFIRDMLVDYFRKNSPVGPVVDNNWRITGADLSKDDPRRAEIIGYIEKGLLPTPYYESYNLGDYDEIVKRVKDA